MSIGKDTRDKDVFYYDNLTRKNSNEEEILGVTMDRKKRKTIYTTMVKSQLNYCPLVWMFCPRRSNNLIIKSIKRALRITCNDHQQILYLCYQITMKSLYTREGFND